MDSRIYQDPDKADADEVLDLSDDVAQQAQSVSQLQSLVESQAQEVQALKAQLSSLSQTLSSLQAQVAGMAPSVDKIPSIETSVAELSAGQSSQDFQIQGINSQLSGVESDVASLQDSVSRVEVSSNIEKVFFLDVNANDCPGMTITTPSGHRIGIYAQEGLGFVLYDYTEQRRLGLCPFS